MIPAIVALMLVASPMAMAESGHNGMDKKYKPLLDSRFEGTHTVTEDMDKASLKDQITVSLSEAADGLDVTSARLGTVTDGETSYLVWILESNRIDSESKIKTVTLHIVDVADASNTSINIVQHDLSKKQNNMNDNPQHNYEGVNKHEKNFAKDRIPLKTGNAELDSLKQAFFDKLTEMRDARNADEKELVADIRAELTILREQINQLR